MVGEAAEDGTPGAAGIHDGGHPGMHAAQIGVDAVADEAAVDVRMQINQTRRDDFSRHVDDLRGFLAGDIRCGAGNLAILYGNIVDAIEVDRRVNHGSTLEQQIVHVSPPITSYPLLSIRGH
ncbi:MAG: hypothetical protein V3S24_17995 [Candidatus Tectomicrobia bacterium]